MVIYPLEEACHQTSFAANSPQGLGYMAPVLHLIAFLSLSPRFSLNMLIHLLDPSAIIVSVLQGVFYRNPHIISHPQ